MRLQSEIVTALLLLVIGAFVTITIYNIISPNLNIINPTGQEISKSIKLNFQLLDYFIANDTLYAYVKPSEPVNYSQVFAILNGRLVKVYPYNSNGSIVNPYDNGLLIVVANLSQTPPNQNGNYKLEVGIANNIIGSFNIEYISNPLINYFQPPIVFNISDSTSSTFICQPSYLTLILYNTQNIPTPAPFQQQIAICNGSINIGPHFAYVNNVTLFNLINSNGSNVYFTTTCNSTPDIYSWYLGQLINGSIYCKIWWVKLDSGIPANSNVTIYMYIGNSSSNYYQQYYPYVGVSPNVDPSRQYDNGKYVFIVYGYFNNTMDGWIGYIFYGSFSPTATPNGIQMTNNYYQGTYILPPNNWNIPLIPLIVEEVWYHTLSADANVIALFGNTNQQFFAGGIASPIVSSGCGGTNITGGSYTTCGGATTTSNLSTYVQFQYWGGTYPPLSRATMLKSAVTYQYLNYTYFPPNAGTIYSYLIVNLTYAQAGYYIYNSNQVWVPLTLLNMYHLSYNPNYGNYTYYNLNYNPFQYGTLQISAGTSGYTSLQYVQWVVARAYPPNGVMPLIYIG
ncbi:MAG: hypothetical protein ACO2ON_03480 [Candidatus Nanopusillus sp.]